MRRGTVFSFDGVSGWILPEPDPSEQQFARYEHNAMVLFNVADIQAGEPGAGQYVGPGDVVQFTLCGEVRGVLRASLITLIRPAIGLIGENGEVGASFAADIPFPHISNVSPIVQRVGDPVTITGTNFGAGQGNSTVTFNGISAGTALFWSPTSIRVKVPAGGATGTLLVIVASANPPGVVDPANGFVSSTSNGVPFTALP